MAKDLPKMKVPTCLIWGKQDSVTPPSVAEEFHKLLPNSELKIKFYNAMAATLETKQK